MICNYRVSLLPANLKHFAVLVCYSSYKRESFGVVELRLYWVAGQEKRVKDSHSKWWGYLQFREIDRKRSGLSEIYS